MKYLVSGSLAVLLLACAQADVGPPPTDLGELAPLVAELQLAEALTNELPVIVRDSLREVYYDNVLADFGYDRPRFDSLLWLVRQEPVWVDSLYTRVGVLLARKQAASGLGE